MKIAMLLLCLPVVALAADDESSHTLLMEHGGNLDSLFMVDRLEQQHHAGNDEWQWGAQAWYGGDSQKLWLKSEGSDSDSSAALEHGEVQALYSRAVAPFWDLQMGLRHDEGIAASRSYAVLGVKGLAPYWFDMDAAMFVGERGQLMLRLETTYDLNLSQKLLLQPRLELNHNIAADTAAGIEQGLTDSTIGLRLRYEIIREFAPYLGVERSIGKTHGDNETRIVAGLRFWY